MVRFDKPSRARPTLDTNAPGKLENRVHRWTRAADDPRPSRFEFDLRRISIHDVTVGPVTVQAKLIIGSTGDIYEREADRVADRVMHMSMSPQQDTPAPSPISQRSASTLQRRPEEQEREDEEQEREDVEAVGADIEESTPEDPRSSPDSPEGEEPDGVVLLRRVPGATTPGAASPTTANGIESVAGGGQPLPTSTRRFMEARFGYDFGRVRTHTDPRADGLSRDLGATAFTVGNDIFFRSGSFDPHGHSGRHLLAHELTHVVQQNGGLDGNNITPVRARAQRKQMEVHANLQGPDHVRIYREGEANLSFIGSSGKKSTPTALGTFSLTKRKDPTKKLGKWGLQYFAPFNGGQGFHSTIAYPSRRTLCKEGKKAYCKPKAKLDTRIKITLVANGDELSHGCIRLNPGDARTLFDTVPTGTTVRIYREKTWKSPPWSTTPPKKGKAPKQKASNTSTGTKTYTVQAGDSLSKIAANFGIEVDDLRKANEGVIREGDVIRPGDELLVP